MAAYGASTCLDTGLGTGFGASPRGAKGFKEDLSHPQFDTAGYLGMHNLENSRPLPGIDRGAQLSQRSDVKPPRPLARGVNNVYE